MFTEGIPKWKDMRNFLNQEKTQHLIKNISE